MNETDKAPAAPEEEERYRLVTRSDFDGLVCAMLLKELELIADIKFVHPKDMQDGKVAVSARDITTNLPYVPGVHLAFDHHHSEVTRVEKQDNHIINPDAPSAARVVYDFYGGKARFPNVSQELMEAVDQADSAEYTEEEILDPKGWVLLNFLMDARTGLGRFRNFTIPNYELMMELIDHCRTLPIERILELPDVKERLDLYAEHADKAKAQLERCGRVFGNLVVLDLREEETIWPINRFAIYAVYRECNISIHVMWGKAKQNVVFAIGKSIINLGSQTDVGTLCLSYGGGGHIAAGTCQVDASDAERVKQELIAKITADG